ncbi:DJ-1/PfpI family protein [Oceanospirillum beijerinckii]|uniref:DJ-1/PfpI family protein n=1 Tax=Oceanospirillum beijerinckii TaxID=64976 RepID=UPI0004111C91|nr:DJ-1/PfpI family protein [Oceanospirillum beijerinckii]
MHISILTFDGFNELDSLIALGILNRIKQPDWRVTLASPTAEVTSMNGVTLQRHISLSEACQADAVLIGSGIKTREIVADHRIIEQLQLDPSRQLIGAQCSGSLILEKLGLLQNIPACTDLTTTPWLQDSGIEVLNQAFFAKDNVASSGGCLASSYLAAWVIARLVSIEAAQEAIHYVAPVGEKERYVQQTLKNILPFLSNANQYGSVRQNPVQGT